MLRTSDIGALFSNMQAVYGHTWAHRADAAAIWQNALQGCTVEEVRRATNQAVKEYPDFPPTLGQFLALAKPSAPANTYLPAPTVNRAGKIGNLALTRVLVKFGGVDQGQLKRLVALKNALVEDAPATLRTEDLERQLRDMAALHDPEAKQRELDEAIRRRSHGRA
jgi:hypothetical protein